MDKTQQIDRIISLLRGLYAVEYPRHNTPEYREFHDTLTDFIYKYHLENSNEWVRISDNLVYHSSQVMVSNEADIILYCLESLKRKLLASKYEPFWSYIHPTIESLVRDRFETGMYADAIEAAFKEINVCVKNIMLTETGEELDGSSLMKKALSVNNPIVKLADISNDTGKNVQLGYMEMFAGAMTGIRNPKAHNNQTISKEDAIRKLNFASMLMYKIDQRM
ncbi:MAG: TIGR02391 family protein [Rikenellaceae bacterium]